MMAETPPLAGRLLIVDDEVRQMQALCDTLSEQGFTTRGFTDGQAALAELRREPFDLLLADLTMPGMDGIALLGNAFQIDPMLVGIIMTGHGTIASAVQAMQSGAIDYIVKPFKLTGVLPVLRRALTVRHLRQKNAVLEKRVRERSLELEVANKELDAFARSVSHDLRTPLNGVIGFVDLLEYQFGSQQPPGAMQLIGQIRLSGQHMLNLIDGLMRLSQSSRQALNLERIDVAELVMEVHRDLILGQAHLSAAPLCVGALEPVRADPLLLRQIYANLLSNAYKFSAQKSRQEIEVGCEMIEGECIYFVKDNGAGFDMTQSDRLFGPFVRLHRAEEFSGTGVGLTIVQRIVSRHGGRIWAEAERGVGASFHFTLGPA